MPAMKNIPKKTFCRRRSKVRNIGMEKKTKMKNKKTSNTWQVTPREAIAIQKILRDEIKLVPLKKEIKKIKYIGGADVSMNLFAKHGFAGFITLSYPSLELVDHAVVKD